MPPTRPTTSISSRAMRAIPRATARASGISGRPTRRRMARAMQLRNLIRPCLGRRHRNGNRRSGKYLGVLRLHHDLDRRSRGSLSGSSAPFIPPDVACRRSHRRGHGGLGDLGLRGRRHEHLPCARRPEGRRLGDQRPDEHRSRSVRRASRPRSVRVRHRFRLLDWTDGSGPASATNAAARAAAQRRAAAPPLGQT